MLAEKQGSNITIPAVFYNMGGFLSNVDGLTVSIYPYGKKPGLDYVTSADAVVLNATPDNLALGSYEYVYSIEETDQVGIWYALWEGTIGTATVNSLITFTVLANGANNLTETQFTGEPVLRANSLYSVSLEGILSVDGESLDSECWFTSKYKPMCISYNMIAAKLASVVSNLTEDTVNYLIYRGTKEAHSITPSGPSCNSAYLSHACKMYVEYWVCLSILDNITGNGGVMKSKQLGDLKIAYGDNTNQIQSLVNRWRGEMAKWERVLNSNGCVVYGGSLPMGIAHQSIRNPDRPNIGRQIREPIGSSQLANDKATLGNRTRFQASYTRPGVPGHYTGGGNG